MKYVYVRILVRDGEREHTHHCLIITKCKNVWFAAMRYVSQFWGIGVRERDFWWFSGEFTARMTDYKELTKDEYETMNRIIY